MKVLMINTVPMERNGIAKCILNYAYALLGEKQKVDILASEWNAELFREVSMKQIGCIDLNGRKTNVLRYIMKLVTMMKYHKYDIVHVHGNSRTMAIELFAAKIAGCSVRIAHNHNTACSHRILHKLLFPFFELSCSGRFACSVSAGKWLFGCKKFTVIPNGFQTNSFQFNIEKRNYYRKKLDLENCFVIGHVGLFNEQKNHIFLLKIFHEIMKKKHNARLLFIGKGEKEEEIRNKAVELGYEDRIIFYGESDEISGLLSAMDVFVFPSKHEGLGIAVLEAQISGLPCVVSTEVPKEIVLGNHICFLGLDESIGIWCDTILRQGRSQTQRGEFYTHHIRTIEQYEIMKNVKLLINIYVNMSSKNQK